MSKRFLLFALIFCVVCTNAQTKLLSWNLENFGKSKSNNSISYIANTIKDFDIIAIQEVVAGYGGPQAVAKLADELNRKGSKWDYTISNPTQSSPHKTERYAFIWKTKAIKKIGLAWLEKKYFSKIEREPYFCTFEYNKKQFTIATFHAITKSNQPETEIKYLKLIVQENPTLNLIFTGDFNCPQSNSVFLPIKQIGYKSSLVNQKTSLKQKCIGSNCLASEFDNSYYNSKKITKTQSGIISFYKNFNSLKDARIVSDHVPIWIDFSIN